MSCVANVCDFIIKDFLVLFVCLRNRFSFDFVEKRKSRKRELENIVNYDKVGRKVLAMMTANVEQLK
jgi:hypothetical protein